MLWRWVRAINSPAVREVGLVLLACFAWGQIVGLIAWHLFRDNLLAYLTAMTLGCFGGGLIIGQISSKLTWPRKRRAMLKGWGYSDEEIESIDRRTEQLEKERASRRSQ